MYNTRFSNKEHITPKNARDILLDAPSGFTHYSYLNAGRKESCTNPYLKDNPRQFYYPPTGWKNYGIFGKAEIEAAVSKEWLMERAGVRPPPRQRLDTRDEIEKEQAGLRRQASRLDATIDRMMEELRVLQERRDRKQRYLDDNEKRLDAWDTLERLQA